MTAPITVVTPSISPRCGPGGLLARAVASVRAQTLQPEGGISVALDVDRRGAAATRQRALDAVRTEWCAFLDDDDTWYPHHLATLWKLAEESGADVAHSWFDGNDPFPMHRGRQFDPKDPHHLTMTLLVRTKLAKAAGFLQPDGPMHQEWFGEDWQFILRLRDLGAKFIGTDEVTWTYQVHGGNTSGLPSRW
jgi:hypothetical protein